MNLSKEIEKDILEHKDPSFLAYLLTWLRPFNVKGLNSITKIKGSDNRICIEYDYIDFKDNNCKCRTPWFHKGLYLARLQFDKPYTEDMLNDMYGEYLEYEMKRYK